MKGTEVYLLWATVDNGKVNLFQELWGIYANIEDATNKLHEHYDECKNEGVTIAEDNLHYEIRQPSGHIRSEFIVSRKIQ